MPEAEEQIRECHRAGDIDAAITLAVETYGDEVYGFLVTRLRDEDVAGDAFAQTCEDLCVSMQKFEWRCSMRTWMYKLARSAASREIRGPLQRGRRGVPLSQVSEIADRISTRTREYLKTEVRDGFAELRAELSPDDQSLLILRVDRRLEWLEVAEILSETELASEEGARAAARLRQRFKTLKEELREQAIARGLIEGESGS